MNALNLKKRLEVASGKKPADIVFKGGTIVNVFTGELMSGDVAIVDGYIAGIGSYSGLEEIDATNKFLSPGLIDGHVHIESAMLTPKEFGRILLQHGVTSAITDPHEIANVAGTEGISYMLETSENLPIDIFIMLPSSVPATPSDNNGATLLSDDLIPFMQHPRVLGLAEVMDFPAVRDGNIDMVEKIIAIQKKQGIIDGHAAGIKHQDLNVYMASGIKTDHEATTIEEATHRLQLGMYLMIREGTVAKDLKNLLPAVTSQNARRCLLVTDDKLIDDLVNEGSVDHSIRLAISEGLDPITAISMATINAAECFELKEMGAIAPGFKADMILLNDLETFDIASVYKNGIQVFDKEKGLAEQHFPAQHDKLAANTLRPINYKPFQLAELALPLKQTLCHVIEIIPNQIVTNHIQEHVTLENGQFVSDTSKDLLKMVVIERHQALGNIGKGIVKGFGIKKGAIATTISHDAHNIVAVGTSDEDIYVAVNHLKKIDGGIVIVSDGEIVESLSLPVAGLLSTLSFENLHKQLDKLNAQRAVLGCSTAFNPFLTLSFLSLSVIPQLKLTDLGYFNFDSFSFISAEV